MNRDFEAILWRVVRGETTLGEFEKWVYRHDDLEDELGESYLSLISSEFSTFASVTEQIRPWIQSRYGDIDLERHRAIVYECHEILGKTQGFLSGVRKLLRLAPEDKNNWSDTDWGPLRIMEDDSHEYPVGVDEQLVEPSFLARFRKFDAEARNEGEIFVKRICSEYGEPP